ncbi:MAG: divalent-cation tolerance protein CutA [Hyphomicrobiaceae bacterium]|nr:divalent-cation tolerance protein CutA [Hyphomicrobiaceae bacterium]
MAQETDLIVVYTTFESIHQAKEVGHVLLKSRLAACMNIVPAMTSIYEWEGEVHETAEAVMLIKTSRRCQKEVLKRTKELHPYDTPALYVLDPLHTDTDFGAWIAGQTEMPTKTVPQKKKRTP